MMDIIYECGCCSREVEAPGLPDGWVELTAECASARRMRHYQYVACERRSCRIEALQLVWGHVDPPTEKA